MDIFSSQHVSVYVLACIVQPPPHFLYELHCIARHSTAIKKIPITQVMKTVHKKIEMIQVQGILLTLFLHTFSSPQLNICFTLSLSAQRQAQDLFDLFHEFNDRTAASIETRQDITTQHNAFNIYSGQWEVFMYIKTIITISWDINKWINNNKVIKNGNCIMMMIMIWKS